MTRARHRYFIRTMCCVYRTDVLQREGLSFGLDEAVYRTVGQRLYFELLQRGYGSVPIPPRQAKRWMVHLAHATMSANAAEFGRNEKRVAGHRRRHQRVLRSVRTDDLLADMAAPWRPAGKD